MVFKPAKLVGFAGFSDSLNLFIIGWGFIPLEALSETVTLAIGGLGYLFFLRRSQIAKTQNCASGELFLECALTGHYYDEFVLDFLSYQLSFG